MERIENGGLIEYDGQSVYYTDTTTIQSGESFYVEKGFGMSEGGIWLITGGQYPELRNVNLDGNEQNPVVEPEVDEPVEVPGDDAGTEPGVEGDAGVEGGAGVEGDAGVEGGADVEGGEVVGE